jgi:uncharacterized membrane protein SpoIIM required for sporulation
VTDARGERSATLSRLLDRVDRGGLGALSLSEVKDLCRLYRQVTIDLSQARTSGAEPEVVRYLNHLAARAHGRIYAAKRLDLRRLFEFLGGGFPRLVRRRGRPILAAVGLLAATALASYLAVVVNPELAYSLFDENMVQYENLRLEKQEGEYKGNFTFSLSESPFVAVAIIGNNVRVAILSFAVGALACVPGVLLMAYNGRMLGTISGIVGNHGYLFGFYSLILTHGVLELTAICIATGAGFVLGWAVIAPGTLPRRDALKNAAPDAFGLLGGSVMLLVIAGLIEGHITPHAPVSVRLCVAALSALFLVVYFGFCGRREQLVRQGSQKAA